jgi:hypothetical protein
MNKESWWGESRVKPALARPMRWEDNIKMDLRRKTL